MCKAAGEADPLATGAVSLAQTEGVLVRAFVDGTTGTGSFSGTSISVVSGAVLETVAGTTEASVSDTTTTSSDRFAGAGSVGWVDFGRW